MTQSKRVDVQTFLNEHPFSGLQWIIFALCFLTVMLDGFDTAAIGYIAPSLIKEWSIDRPSLAPVLTAALFGLSTGAIAAGPLADRMGRKQVLLVSVLIMGTACIGSALSAGLNQLIVWRFVTGLGLGAAMPNAVTMMSEYSQDRHRAIVTNAMFTGFPLGAASGGGLAAWMIPQFGWRGVLIVGGIVPLVLAVLLAWQLPESVRYMVAKRYPAERIRMVLSRISGTVPHTDEFVMHEKAPAASAKAGVSLVLSGSYVVGSVMLWLTYFMGLVIFYGLINWMPTLLKDTGISQQNATLISALFPLGGAGAILFGWLMDRFNANYTVAVGYALTALAVYVMGQTSGQAGILMVVVFVAGTIMNTSQTCLPALAAAFYPTEGRATGVSWMMAIGRFGGIAGSFLVAELARRQFTVSEIFSSLSMAGVIAAAALLIKQFKHPQDAVEKTAVKGESLGH